MSVGEVLLKGRGRLRALPLPVFDPVQLPFKLLAGQSRAFGEESFEAPEESLVFLSEAAAV